MIADRITILRDGETVGTKRNGDVTRSELINMIVGRDLAAVFPKREVRKGEVALELRTERKHDSSEIHFLVRLFQAIYQRPSL